MKHPVRYRLEYGLARAIVGLLRLLPLAVASGCLGALARSVGPHIGVSRRARSNLRKAMPELSEAEIEAIVREVWDNLGRTAAELTHLADFRVVERATAPGDIEVVGREHLDAVKATGKAALLFAGHIGNWEMQALTTLLLGLPAHVVYRTANNPMVDDLIIRMRRDLTPGGVPKGTSGARQVLRLLKEGSTVGMLVDQKMNDGIAVPFFGRPAMTAPALAQLALRFGAPILPVRCERLHGVRFRITYYPPLDLPDSGNRQADVLAVMTRVNGMLEQWIRERPGQWLWLHKRWPD